MDTRLDEGPIINLDRQCNAWSGFLGVYNGKYQISVVNTEYRCGSQFQSASIAILSATSGRMSHRSVHCGCSHSERELRRGCWMGGRLLRCWCCFPAVQVEGELCDTSATRLGYTRVELISLLWAIHVRINPTACTLFPPNLPCHPPAVVSTMPASLKEGEGHNKLETVIQTWNRGFWAAK